MITKYYYLGGAPFVLSTPYFLHGHPRYSFDTNLTAVESLHETYIDIEPVSYKKSIVAINYNAIIVVSTL